jgi:hypothetical protein
MSAFSATSDSAAIEAITDGVAAVSMPEEARRSDVATTKRGTPCKRCLKMKAGGKCYQHQPKPSEGVSVDVASSLTHIVPLPSSPDESAASAPTAATPPSSLFFPTSYAATAAINETYVSSITEKTVIDRDGGAAEEGQPSSSASSSPTKITSDSTSPGC